MLNGKENNEVSTICFEVRIPRKKQRIIMEWFHQKLKGSHVKNQVLSEFQKLNNLLSVDIVISVKKSKQISLLKRQCQLRLKRQMV